MSTAIIGGSQKAPLYQGSLVDFEALITDETTTIEEFNKNRAPLSTYKLIDGGDFRCTALAKATYLGNENLIPFIVQEAGPEILKVGDIYGRTSLHYATYHLQCNVMHMLIALGSPLNMTTTQRYYDYDCSTIVPAGATPLDIALKKTHSVGICFLLLLNGASANLPMGQTELSTLVKTKNALDETRKGWAQVIDAATTNNIFPSAILQLIADYASWQNVEKLSLQQ